MVIQSRSIHTLLARELTTSEINQVSGGDPICGEGATDVSTEPTYGDTGGWGCYTPPWETSDRCWTDNDDDGSWDFTCD
jgi:hypothetical protein